MKAHWRQEVKKGAVTCEYKSGENQARFYDSRSCQDFTRFWTPLRLEHRIALKVNTYL